MGDINVKNLTPAQQAVYKEQKALGKSDEEAYKFAVAEGLSTKQDPVDSSQIPNSEPQPKQETPWYAKAGLALLGVGGVALALLTKGKSAKIGMGIAAVGAAGTLASCGDNTINQDVNINIDIKNANTWEEIKQWLEDNGYGNCSIETIIKLLQDNNKDLKVIIETLESMGKKLDAIYKALLSLGVQADVIINLLGELGDKVDILIDNSVKNTEQGEKLAEILNRIFDEVRNGNKLVGDNNKLLTEILGMLGTLQAGDQDKIEVLNAILAKLEVLIQKGDQLDENDKKIQALLGKILAAINKLDGDLRVGVLAILEKMDKMDANNLDMLTKILEKIEQGGNDKDYTDILNAILAKLNESVDNNNQMNDDIRALLNSILDNIQNFNADMKTSINAILAKLDKMDENQTKFFKEVLTKMDKMDEQDQKFYAAVLAKLDQLGAGQIAALEKLLKAIENGNKIAKGTYEVVLKILDQIGKLGDKADKILEVLANIGSGVSVSLDEIKQLLADIKAEQQNGNNILTDIDSKIGMMLVVVNGMKNEFGDKLDTIIAKLEALLGKECNHEDLINILLEIKVIIQQNGGNNNEGILDDLEDLLG